jgi:hypothetical protein
MLYNITAMDLRKETIKAKEDFPFCPVHLKTRRKQVPEM